MARDRPSPYGGAGFSDVARGPVPRDLSPSRSMARDRPSPYGERGSSPPVARGPVPRDLSPSPGMARDRPSPYGIGTLILILPLMPILFPEIE